LPFSNSPLGGPPRTFTWAGEKAGMLFISPAGERQSIGAAALLPIRLGPFFRMARPFSRLGSHRPGDPAEPGIPSRPKFDTRLRRPAPPGMTGCCRGSGMTGPPSHLGWFGAPSPWQQLRRHLDCHPGCIPGPDLGLVAPGPAKCEGLSPRPRANPGVPLAPGNLPGRFPSGGRKRPPHQRHLNSRGRAARPPPAVPFTPQAFALTLPARPSDLPSCQGPPARKSGHPLRLWQTPP